MNPMSDDAMSMSNQLLSPHLCQSTPLFGCCWRKVQHSAIKFGAKLMLFGEIPQILIIKEFFATNIGQN
jgi:hypothetical protein